MQKKGRNSSKKLNSAILVGEGGKTTRNKEKASRQLSMFQNQNSRLI